MGLIHTLKRRFRAKAADPLEAFAWLLADSTGAPVTASAAVRVIAVFACLRVIAEDIGKLPFKLYQTYDPLDERKRRVAREHPVHRLIASRPNANNTSQQFRETMTALAALYGGGYAVKLASAVDGEVYELLPVLPDAVQIEQADDYTLNYKIRRRDGTQQTFRREDVFHLKGLSLDFIDGARTFSLARKAIELAAASADYQVNLARHGVRPSGFLSTDITLSKDQADEARQQLQDKYGGPEGARGLMLLHSGLKFQQMSMTGRDAEILETRKHETIEVCQAFRVHPNKLYAMGQAQTYASAEQFGIEYVQDTVLPWAVRWEQTVEHDLLSDADIADGYYAKMLLQGLLRGDMAARGEFYAKACGRPWLSANEVRVLEDYDPDDGLDEVVLPLNMAPKEKPDA